MINLVVKYLLGELTPDEKNLFLFSVTEKNTLRNELTEFDHLLGHLSLLHQKDDNLKTQISLLNFLKGIDIQKERV